MSNTITNTTTGLSLYTGEAGYYISKEFQERCKAIIQEMREGKLSRDDGWEKIQQLKELSLKPTESEEIELINIFIQEVAKNQDNLLKAWDKINDAIEEEEGYGEEILSHRDAKKGKYLIISLYSSSLLDLSAEKIRDILYKSLIKEPEDKEAFEIALWLSTYMLEDRLILKKYNDYIEYKYDLFKDW